MKTERKRGHELPDWKQNEWDSVNSDKKVDDLTKSEHSMNFKWGENECLLNISRNDDEKILSKFWNYNHKQTKFILNMILQYLP